MSRDLTPQGLPVGWSDSSLVKGGGDPVFGGGCLARFFKLAFALIAISIGLAVLGKVGSFLPFGHSLDETAPSQAVPADAVLFADQHLASSPLYKPRTLSVMVDDGSLDNLSAISWSEWTTTSAHGTATGNVWRPQPESQPAGDGQSPPAGVEIILSDPRSECGKTFFATVEIRWTPRRPGGGPSAERETVDVTCA